MKKLLLIGSLLVSSATFAHKDNENNISFSTEQCDVEFKNDIRIKESEIEIYTADNHSMKIIGANELSIDGTLIKLDATQQKALSNYDQSLRSSLPEVADIALEGVKLANVAINEVANTFNLSNLDSITQLMTDIEIEVNNSFYQQDAFVMGQQNFKRFSDQFESEFNDQIAAAVQSAVMQSMGSILMAVGSQIMDSEGDMQSFEQRIENMQTVIEDKVEQQAQQLEKRADALCPNFAVIAEHEQQLVTLIPKLAAYPLFNFKENE